MKDGKLIFEKSAAGRRGHLLPNCDVPVKQEPLPAQLARGGLDGMPEVSELDVVRHFTGLSMKNHSVDSGFYPLGSCTMKYNPKINEDVSALAGFTSAHPLADCMMAQGSLRLMFELSGMLCEITGMDNFSLQPAAGAHGELAGLMIMKAYHEKNGDMKRTKILVPDTAHGTNPASAAMAGFETVQIASDAEGNVDLASLRAKLSDEVAGLMLTNPSTLGLFETRIAEIAEMVHASGGLLYYDGANMNAIMGITRPGDMGFDVVHLNLHKTFSTPHGGGGPGAGPVGVKHALAPFLPMPAVVKDGNRYAIKGDMPDTIGRMRSFYGNFGVLVRAYAYVLTMGTALRKASEMAVLNANYLKKLLAHRLAIPFGRSCMHEFVASGTAQKDASFSTLDVAKRMIDYGVHPPTIYFPLIVKEAMMFEPTETESMQTLQEFAAIIEKILDEGAADPAFLKAAPHHAPVGRLDDTKAARNPVLNYFDSH